MALPALVWLKKEKIISTPAAVNPRIQRNLLSRVTLEGESEPVA